MAQTGNSATITFGSSGFTASYTRLGGTATNRDSLEVTHLGSTTYKAFQPDDLSDPGEMSVEFQWDQSASTFPPINAVAETITVTYPMKSGETTAATLSGSGFLTNSTSPDLVNGEIMSGEATIKWAGTITYTAGSE
tara:strand:+ start:1275 stop:1685 length:411 start_codon:yes stop_codon:yes gene_type:complete